MVTHFNSQRFQVSNTLRHLCVHVIAFVFNKIMFYSDFICFFQYGGNIDFTRAERHIIFWCSPVR